MTYYNLPSRNGSSIGSYPQHNVGVLLQENGDSILLEDGSTEILLEHPVNDPNLPARNGSSYTLPQRN